MKEAGRIEIITPDAPDGVRMATAQCVHCGAHFVTKPPTGIKKALTSFEAMRLEQQGKTVRGWCMNCNGPICGPQCAECVPLEAKLEIAEGTRNPTAVSVAGGLYLPPSLGE